MQEKQHMYNPAQGLELTMRPLRLEDLPDMLDIEHQGYSHPWTQGVFADCFKSGYRVWGACLDGVLVGYAVVVYVLDEAQLLNLCVHPSARGYGVGRLLLRHLITEAVREGMNQVVLEVRLTNSVACKLYRSEGFEEIGRRPGYYPGPSEREDARVMSLLLHA